MKILGMTMLALGAMFAASCGKAETHAKAAMDTATTMATDAANKLKDVDWSKLGPAKLTEAANTLGTNLSKGLSEVKDAATAENLAKAYGPIVDKLVAAKNSLAGSLPDMTALKNSVADFTTKFGKDGAIMAKIQPLLDKLKALLQ